MSAIDALVPLIYHEKQQEGSMLCAQHALNSLLQGPYFSPAELAEIAHRLDEAEHGYLEGSAGSASTNMDDTGFFSIQVLEEALAVWNLTLVRWRSEAMRPYQDHPHTQMAFILNQSQHWYTLRRFGRVSPDPALEADPGDGHWFNLNSFLNRPERIGKLYLGMFLQQAETEGYSVFAVVQRDPEAPLAIPRTDADQLAASIPESAAGDFSSRAAGSASASRSAHPFQGVEGLEDEDFELQAALQASLSGGNFDLSAFAAASSHGTPPPLYTARSSTATYQHGGGASSTSAVRREYEVIEDDDDDDEIVELPGPPPRATEPADPVAASMARQRAVMERMARMQEVALQQQYQEEVAGFDAMARRRQRAPPEGQDDEDELFRRALAESEALAQQHAARQVEEAESASTAPAPPVWHQHRVYDDEDQELQAALRASLETVPEGFRVTTPPPILETSRSAAVERPSAAATLQPPQPPMQRQASSDVETESEAEVPEPQEQLSMEEIRRRRLAKFGG